MKTEKIIPSQAAAPSKGSRQALRQRAEDLFREKAAGMGETLEALPSEETRQILHELRVHQIELEMQNEEMRQTQTELEASRVRYFNLYDLAPVGYFTLSDQGVILEANLKVATMLGVTRSTLVKQPLPRFILPEDQDIFYRHRKLLFETHSTSSGQAGAAQVCELRLMKNEAAPFWVRIDATATVAQDPSTSSGQGAAGAPVCRVTMIDITDRKQVEDKLGKKNEELTLMTQQLWQTAKLATLGELAASIAHELNNPLTTIGLHIELLRTQLPPENPQQKGLEIVEQEIERMGKLVSNLLEFSRRGQRHVSSLNLQEEIEKTIELVHFHLRKQNVQIQKEFSADLPLVQADCQQLRQLFLNLLTNAGDAMAEGGTLTIRVRAESRGQEAEDEVVDKGQTKISEIRNPKSEINGNAFVVIEFIDTGIGISPEDLPNVMEPFFTRKAEGKGTGLGLAICKRIVEEHKGAFEITSQLGRGTVVRLILPT